MKVRNKIALTGSICLLLSVAAFGSVLGPPPTAHVEVSIVDDGGSPVPGADVSVYFGFFDRNRASTTRGSTDKTGLFRVSGKTDMGMVFVSAGKTGHYGVRFEKYVQDFPDVAGEYEKAWKRGTWSAEPIRLDVVLKRVLEPKRLTLHSVDPKPFPVVGKPFSLDLETLEWCPPYGQGKHADATMVFESWKDPEHRLSFMRKLTVSMPNAADGFYVAKLDSRSDFPYAYRADTNAVYRKEGVLLLDRREDRIVEQRFPADDEYLIFRTRTETNSEGRVTSAHYGRVGEKPSHMFGLKAAVWFNPDENDTNLEDGWHE